MNKHTTIDFDPAVAPGAASATRVETTTADADADADAFYDAIEDEALADPASVSVASFADSRVEDALAAPPRLAMESTVDVAASVPSSGRAVNVAFFASDVATSAMSKAAEGAVTAAMTAAEAANQGSLLTQIASNAAKSGVEGIAGGVTAAVAQTALEAARTAIIEQNRDQYNINDIKNKLQSELQAIKDDTEALRNVDFKTAYDRLQLWHNSTQPINSTANILNLWEANSHAARAFNTVLDPLVKMTAVSMIIFATYHHVAFTTRLEDGSPDWTAGKREAQQRFTYYMGEMKEMKKASEEELGLSRRRFFKEKVKRRKMLLSFINLSAAVHALYPSSLNLDHPRFERLEDAVHRAIKQGPDVMLSARVSHILTDPMEAGTLRGHIDSVLCCAVSADDTRAISGSGDTTLRVWDLESGEVIHTLKGHTDAVRCCAVFSDGTRAISGSNDYTLRVWDIGRGEEIHTLEGHTNIVYCCAVFADGTKAISGSKDITLKVWDLQSGEVIHTLKGHTNSVSCCAVFAEGTKAISGSWDKTLRLWDIGSGEAICTLKGHTSYITCCAVFADSTRVISGSLDTIKVWDLRRSEAIHTLLGHTSSVTCCSVFADGTRAISGSDGLYKDNRPQMWDLRSGEVIHTLNGHAGLVKCCAVFADGTKAISGSSDSTLKVWNLPHRSCSPSVPMLPAGGNNRIRPSALGP